MKRMLLSFLSVILISSVSMGQDFTITGSTPANGTTSVDDTTQITFTFSEGIDIDLMDPFDPGFELIVFPLESIELGDISLNGDNTEMTIDVIHSDEANFIWTFYGASSLSGKELDEPYVLTYSTAGSLPSTTVSGTVSLSGEEGSPLSSVKGTVVYLFSSNPFIEEDCEEDCEDGPDLDVVGGALVDASTGDYTINYVGDGTYFPIAINLILDNFEDEPTILAIYDPNADGAFDTITVSGTNLTGIDLSFLSFAGTTALANIQGAIDIATAINSNLDLYVFGGDEYLFDFEDFSGPDGPEKALQEEFTASGLSQNWSYLFHSPTDDLTVLINYGPFGTVTIDTLDQEELDEILDVDSDEEFSFDLIDPLPTVNIDSDSAATIANANGGLEFLNSSAQGIQFIEIEYIASNANFIAEDIIPDGVFFWEVIYIRAVLDPVTFDYFEEELAVYIDLETGAFLGSDLELALPFPLKDGLAPTVDAAKSRDSSNELIFVNGFSVLERNLDVLFKEALANDGSMGGASEGFFRGFEYRFYSSDGDSVSSFFYDGYEAFVPEFEPFDFIPEPFTAADMAPIDTTMLIDSDSVMAIAGANGGMDFLNSEFQGDLLLESNVSIQLGNFVWDYPPELDANTVVYNVFYNRQSIDLIAQRFYEDGGGITINAATGEILQNSLPVSNEDNPEIANEVSLLQNYPNPFNPTTNIPFELNRAQQIQVDIFNILGQKVATIADGMFQSGLHTLTWDASSLSSGIYIYQLRTETSVHTRKLMLVK